MSADVFIQVIRKSDGCPFERIYLGGNRLRDEIRYDNNYNVKFEMEATVMGCYAYKFVDRKEVEKFISENKETIESYGGYNPEEYDEDLDDFDFWLLIEE